MSSHRKYKYVEKVDRVEGRQALQLADDRNTDRLLQRIASVKDTATFSEGAKRFAAYDIEARKKARELAVKALAGRTDNFFPIYRELIEAYGRGHADGCDICQGINAATRERHDASAGIPGAPVAAHNGTEGDLAGEGERPRSRCFCGLASCPYCEKVRHDAAGPAPEPKASPYREPGQRFVRGD